MTFDLNVIRQQFPSLDRPAIFLDNPAGTQISKQSLDRINRYLLEHNANPTEEEIRASLEGNFCRCTGYHNIVKSVQWAAIKMKKEVAV